MYDNQSLPFPVDRPISAPWNYPNPPPVNYQFVNCPPQLSQLVPGIGLMLATLASQKSQQNPLRMFTFNQLSQNGWNNNSFVELLTFVMDGIARQGNIQIDQNLMMQFSDFGLQHVTALNLRNFPLLQTMLHPQVIQEINQYLMSIGQGIQNQQQAYPQQANMYQPAPMANSGGSFINRGGFGPDIMATGGEPIRQDDRFSNNPNVVPRESDMDRSQHQMGVNLQQPQQNLQSIMPNVIIPPVAALRSNGESIGVDSIVSFKELSDTIFAEQAEHMRTAGFDVNYCSMKETKYHTSVGKRYEKEYLNFIEKLTAYINQEIKKDEMASVMSNLPARLRSPIKMLLDYLTTRINNLLRVLKIESTISSIIDDLGDLYPYCDALGKPVAITNLKDGLRDWIFAKIEIVPQVVSDEEGKCTSASPDCYAVTVDVDIVVVNVDSDTFGSYSLSQLDFLAEMRTTLIYVITTDDILFVLQLCAKNRNGEMIPYTPVNLSMVGQLF